jgi:hypothetical protein
MLTIREDQMRILSLARFELWMVTHLRTYFPHRCSHLADAELLAIVRLGVEKGRRYGLAKEADVCRFTDVMLVMGSEFDTDPQMPWAAAILSHTGFAGPESRMEMLHQAACDHLRQLDGPPPAVESDQEVWDEDEEDEEDDPQEDETEDDQAEDDSEDDAEYDDDGNEEEDALATGV